MKIIQNIWAIAQYLWVETPPPFLKCTSIIFLKVKDYENGMQ